MQGARRRPYVDMVEEGNAADDRPGRNPGGDGAIWAHLFVGSPRNIDILLRALLLDLHPSSPPSHTCLVMKQVLKVFAILPMYKCSNAGIAQPPRKSTDTKSSQCHEKEPRLGCESANSVI